MNTAAEIVDEGPGDTVMAVGFPCHAYMGRREAAGEAAAVDALRREFGDSARLTIHAIPVGGLFQFVALVPISGP